MVNGDLISRQMVFDVLIPFLNEKDDMELAGQILVRISMIPTVYDVEKVVEELRKHHKEEMVTRNPIISLDSAISIVRNGGKE